MTNTNNFHCKLNDRVYLTHKKFNKLLYGYIIGINLIERIITIELDSGKLFKKLNIYTEKKCNVSEYFISKFPKIKMIMETNHTYINPKTKQEMSKTDWSWTFEGAKALVDYLISIGKVSYCENSGFKLVKEN